MKFLLLLSLVALAKCSPIAQEESVMRLVIGNFVNCMNNDLGMCLKEHALKATERLRAVRQLNIIDGITLINNGPKEARSLELDAEPEARSKQVTDKLWESTSDLIQNSELELSWGGPADDEESRAIGDAAESRGKKKKKEIKKKLKILIPLLLIAKVKAILLVVASIVIIAASLAKLAILAKIAFIAKVIGLLKELIQKKKMQHADQGWMAAAEEHGSHGGGGGGWESQGWSRSSNEANKLAYSAYSP